MWNNEKLVHVIKRIYDGSMVKFEWEYYECVV